MCLEIILQYLIGFSLQYRRKQFISCFVTFRLSIGYKRQSKRCPFAIQKGMFYSVICRLLKCRCELVLQQWLFFTDSFLYCYHSVGRLKTLCLSHNDFLSTYYIYAFRQTLRVFTYVSSLQIIDFLWLGWDDIDNAINLCWLPSQYDFHIIQYYLTM